MNTSQTTLYRALLAELADIERQQQDDTLPHSDQHILDQAWEDVTNRIDELEEMLECALPEEEDWRDARVVLDRPPTPRPSSPLRIAPPPPPARPPVISIPKGMSVTFAPPPPRPAGNTICNCDSDGECVYCEEERLKEEELERWNNMVDDREGCASCSGCAYCRDEDRYDGADEV